MFNHCAIPMLASTIVDFVMIKYVRQKRKEIFLNPKFFHQKSKMNLIWWKVELKPVLGSTALQPLVILFDSQCDQKILKNLPQKWPEQAEKPKCLHQISI
jgi:hypothetical protein